MKLILPKLQIALDHSDLESALVDIFNVGDVVDIIEIGTILCLQEGKKAINYIKRLYPNKIIVADTKCADAGRTIAKNVSDAGADFMTVICCATIPTMQAAQEEVQAVQVELYGNWTYEQAQQWRDIGITQVIYHQSRDALLSGETWGEKDLAKVKELINMGFKVSVTGGLNIDILELFKGLNIYNFIIGRGILTSKNPKQTAQEFRDEIKRIWG